jgi:hypothetical protein
MAENSILKRAGFVKADHYDNAYADWDGFVTNKHPAEWNKPAPVLVSDALEQAFPCK